MVCELLKLAAVCEVLVVYMEWMMMLLVIVQVDMYAVECMQVVKCRWYGCVLVML